MKLNLAKYQGIANGNQSGAGSWQSVKLAQGGRESSEVKVWLPNSQGSEGSSIQSSSGGGGAHLMASSCEWNSVIGTLA